MNMSVITINFDSILDTALKGARRAAVFMGLGLNAALDPAFKDYELTRLSFIQLIPSNASEDEIASFKTNFATWITGNGLREVVESFAVFLDQLHFVSQSISVAQGQASQAEANKCHKNFTRNGLKHKLQALRDDFGIVTDHIDHLCSIQKARNCLTHRRGIVAPIDCNHNSELGIRWIGLDVTISRHSGSMELMDLPLKEPLPVEGGETINVVLAERMLVFGVGALIQISPKDVAEICFFITSEARMYLQSAVEYAERMGIEIQTKS